RLLLCAGGLCDAANDGRLLAEVAGPRRAGDDAGAAAVGLLAAVVEAERLGDEARALMVLDRERPLVEEGVRVGDRVPARRDGDLGQVEARASRLVHVALREHRHPARGRHEPEGHVPAPVDEVGRRYAFTDTRAVARAGAAVEGAIA